jgi:hypothetical protein
MGTAIMITHPSLISSWSGFTNSKQREEIKRNKIGIHEKRNNEECFDLCFRDSSFLIILFNPLGRGWGWGGKMYVILHNYTYIRGVYIYIYIYIQCIYNEILLVILGSARLLLFLKNLMYMCYVDFVFVKFISHAYSQNFSPSQ